MWHIFERFIIFLEYNYNMDKLDLKLISLLNEEDYTTKKLASKLKKKPETITKHIDNLIKTNTITHFYYNIDFTRLRFTQLKLYLKFYGIDKKDDFIKYLQKINNVIWIAELEGKYDLGFSILTKDLNEISSIFEKLSQNFGDIIQEKEFLITQESIFYNYDFSQKKKKDEIIHYYMPKEITSLKDNEIELLKAIAINLREPLHVIVNKHGIKYDCAHYLYKKLKTEKILRENKPHIDLEKIGFSLYKICINFKHYDEKIEKSLNALVKNNNNIIQYLKLIGHWDYEIEFITDNKKELKEFIDNFRQGFKNEIHDYFILEIEKEHLMKLIPF